MTLGSSSYTIFFLLTIQSRAFSKSIFFYSLSTFQHVSFIVVTDIKFTKNILLFFFNQNSAKSHFHQNLIFLFLVELKIKSYFFYPTFILSLFQQKGFPMGVLISYCLFKCCVRVANIEAYACSVVFCKITAWVLTSFTSVFTWYFRSILQSM